MEKYWDNEIKKFFVYDKKRKVFDYDVDGAPELKEGISDEFEGSLLHDVIKTLSDRSWDPADKRVLGKKNRKIYDYVKTVCFISYLVSTNFIPNMSQRKYDELKILEDPEYTGRLRDLSVHALADAIDSIALVWLLTWDRYNKLIEGAQESAKKIKSAGGTVVRS